MGSERSVRVLSAVRFRVFPEAAMLCLILLQARNRDPVRLVDQIRDKENQATRSR
jgi:hypothetical protein